MNGKWVAVLAFYIIDIKLLELLSFERKLNGKYDTTALRTINKEFYNWNCRHNIF